MTKPDSGRCHWGESEPPLPEVVRSVWPIPPCIAAILLQQFQLDFQLRDALLEPLHLSLELAHQAPLLFLLVLFLFQPGLQQLQLFERRGQLLANHGGLRRQLRDPLEFRLALSGCSWYLAVSSARRTTSGSSRSSIWPSASAVIISVSTPITQARMLRNGKSETLATSLAFFRPISAAPVLSPKQTPTARSTRTFDGLRLDHNLLLAETAQNRIQRREPLLQAAEVLAQRFRRGLHRFGNLRLDRFTLFGQAGQRLFETIDEAGHICFGAPPVARQNAGRWPSIRRSWLPEPV